MSYKELKLEHSYDSDNYDLLNDFYIPVLSKSIEYNRIAGYFSSTSLAIAAKGIIGLIENGGTMNLIASPKLSKEDVSIINTAISQPETFITNKLILEIDQIENNLVKDHVYALGWMIANKKLTIKIATVYDDSGNLVDSETVNKMGIFHQKVGYLKDTDNNYLSFSGSINETCNGWLNNIEEFKVFKGWKPIEEHYCKSDIEKFDSFWNNRAYKVKTVNLPIAVTNKLIEVAPNDIHELETFKKYKKSKSKNKITLFDYQKKAINNWIDNNYCGIFQMATGTGKTFTALGCLDSVSKLHRELITIIACPQNTLMLQWQKELNTFGISYDRCIIADSTNSKYKVELADSLMDITLNEISKVIILTTHATLSSTTFIEIIKKHKRYTKIMLIADEVHGLGSQKQSKGLIEEYDLKLGLSATPKRWHDEKGTDNLYQYFHDIVYEFSIKQALTTINPLTNKTYLVKYRYIPIFVSLSEIELEEYMEKTKKIITLLNSKEKSEEDILENLLFQRANIHKNAYAKYEALDKILNYLDEPIDDTLIFTSPEQIDNVMEKLRLRKIIAHRFTEKESTTPSGRYGGISQREFIINKFKDKSYQALVAIKCMDEGIDIPSADTAILMASSTNPREYIQRIGRVIRQSPTKTEAVIYDIIIKPSTTKLHPSLRKLEKNLFQKELLRAEDIAINALNNSEAIQALYKQSEIY